MGRFLNFYGRKWVDLGFLGKKRSLNQIWQDFLSILLEADY